ncbi:MAG: tripartite tricarboxylate transporter TctB family protein, partial [Planctomycetes bacterium]|nr:tripartite tricarboxylate transporter TctB family protein [Planctomycetota bacterium]
VVISFLYVLVMPYAGFVVSSAVMLVVFMLVMGVRSIPVLILVPLGEITFLFYVFEKYLMLYLPDAYPLKSWLGIA